MKHLKERPSYDAAVSLQEVTTERAQLIADMRASWRLIENSFYEMVA